jgi:hypothetical protein
LASPDFGGFPAVTGGRTTGAVSPRGFVVENEGAVVDVVDDGGDPGAVALDTCDFD